MTPYRLRARLGAALAAGLAAATCDLDTAAGLEVEGVISVVTMTAPSGGRVYRLAGSPDTLGAYALGAALWKLGGEIMSDTER